MPVALTGAALILHASIGRSLPCPKLQYTTQSCAQLIHIHLPADNIFIYLLITCPPILTNLCQKQYLLL